jgi:hypothetical protein
MLSLHACRSGESRAGTESLELAQCFTGSAMLARSGARSSWTMGPSFGPETTWSERSRDRAGKMFLVR